MFGLGWIGDHFMRLLASPHPSFEVRETGVRVTEGPLHYTLHWDSLSHWLGRYVHAAQLGTLAKVLRTAARYVDQAAQHGPGGPAKAMEGDAD